jgi:hypothetical protein
MEDFFINIDSRYRDITQYPNESKYKVILNRIYKNIISVKFSSIELINTISYIDSEKNNNYLTFHFPSKEQDPIGYKYVFPEGFYNTFALLSNTINNDFSTNINILSNFEKINRERYFYLFYLAKNVEIVITDENLGEFTLTLNSNWYSLYGFVNYIINYINANNITKFIVSPFDLHIRDLRFKSSSPLYNNIRVDTIDISEEKTNTSNTQNNKINMKNSIYSVYIEDIVNFTTDMAGNGYLDQLVFNTYNIQSDKNYVLSGNLISSSKYYTNNINTIPDSNSSQLYSFNISQDPTSTKTIITSKHNAYYYYDTTSNSWSSSNNANNSTNDLPPFELNIETTSTKGQGYAYPSIGHYMGFRKLNIKSNNFTIIADKLGNYIGDPYLFIKINDWGHIEQFNQKHLAKVLLTPDLGLVKLDEFYAKEYKFKQPQNIQSLSIELVDYLGNLVDLRGLDYSFTLYMSQINNSDLKAELEYNFLDKKKTL